MIRCPNFRSDKVREDFNGVLQRLGGVAMSADDIAPRQPYLAKLNETQIAAYHTAHYLWNAHKKVGDILDFLDALDAVNNALEAPVNAPEQPSDATKPPDHATERPKNAPIAPKDAQAPETGPSSSEAAPLSNLPSIELARSLLERLRAGKPITSKILQEEAGLSYGGKLSEGRFDRKDMADALELAVNMHIAQDPALRVTGDDWRGPIAKLDALLSKLPTQRVRSDEQVSFQQFSTPPTYAAAATYAANLREGDTLIEPSAGTGSIVAAAMRPGVKIIANELSERRTALLRALIGSDGKVFRENAEQLNNVLPDDVKPNVAVMNPPFSQTAGRMGDRKVPMVAPMHIEQALKRLEDGGRLVAIVGRGMTMGQPGYRAWWSKISAEYTVRANIGVDGKVYEKYGTTFGTRLLVIDKIAPSGDSKPVLADAQTVEDLMRLLEPIRNGRSADNQGEQRVGEPGGAQVDHARSEADAGPALLAPPPTGGVGTDEQGAGRLASERSVRAGRSDTASVRVERGQRDELAFQQSERPGQAGATGEPAKAAAGDGQAGARRGARAQRDLQPSGEPKSGLAAGGERVELEHAAPGTQGASEISDSLYDNYKPQRVRVAGAKPHPSKLVESAAMASVSPPTPTYKPNLPRAVIEKGLLSDAQLEAVVYAGEAHGKMLPAAEGETAKRKGYFIGDGTGVGKGREISGIFLDNWNQGRRRGVWVSEKNTLLEDAKRDWSGLQQNPNLIFNIGKVKTGEPIQTKQGIGFVTYDTLKGGMSDQAALSRGEFVRKQQVKVNGQSGKVAKFGKTSGGQPGQITVNLDNGSTVTVPSNEVQALEKANIKSRVDQIVDWLGEDFDGVIALDESHNMANATGGKGDRGKKDAAMKAIAGMELQKRLPNARVVYDSATGATEVSNLAYADRLGLWGRGTPFASREAFVTQVEEGGIAAMELIARDMKALGLYTARNLSYDGVEYDRLEHKLDENQREIYDTLAEAWQHVLRNINAALKSTKAEKDGRAKGAAYSAFWGAHQRFFNQIVTAMQMPTVIKAVEKDIEAGRQAVLQLTNTNEASQERAAAKAQSAEEIEDLDITPRDQIIQLVEHSFPTQAYEEYIDDKGKKRARPVLNSKREPVQDRGAVAARARLIEELASIRVPQGPLEMILDHFGIDTVAEVTGRGRRFVRKPDEKTGEMRRVEESRPGSSNIAETDNFQAGKKKVLVFSEAGGTGRSYHADNTAPSKDARRAHYVVQGGWRADKAVQGLGRTHRSNQASAPLVRLPTTDLPGQKRFISSIARRLGQLGALTKGERKAGDQGIFNARDNLESIEATTALTQFFKDVVNGAVPDITVNDFEEQTGLSLRLTDDDGRVMGMATDFPPITQFLNRLLSLKIDMQNRVFDAFSERLDAVIEARREAGLLDVGMETVRADKITKASEQTVHTVEGSGAETKYVKLQVSKKFVPTEFDKVASNEWRPVEAWLESPNGKVYAAAKAPSLTDSSGKIIDNFRLVSPVSDSRTVPKLNIEKPDSKWKKIERSEASALWRKEIAAAPEFITRDMHLITGAILPIWDRLKGNPRVVRLQTDNGERLIGRVVPNEAIAATLKALGAEAQFSRVTPPELFHKIAAGGRATLANGWTLSRRLVAGEQRIELNPRGVSFSEARELKRDGVFSEIIDYKMRYFVPMEARRGALVLGKLTEYRPIADIQEAGAAPDDMAAGDEPMFSIRGTAAKDGREGAVKAESDQLAEAVARRIFPELRIELDKLGLEDVDLNLPGKLTARTGGKTYLLNGHYLDRTITVALDADNIRQTMHHEVLHALRDLGLFKDGEWGILSTKARQAWRKQYPIDRLYSHLDDEGKDEEGVAHAYADWAAGKATVDGRIARLFKRIKAFFEALRNALHGLGFKTAEDVFKDIRSGEVGRRDRAGVGGEPMFSVRDDAAPAALKDNPKLSARIRERIEAALDSKFAHKFIEGTQDLSHPVKLLQRDLEERRSGAFADPEDFYTRKRLYPGRVGAWTDTFNRKHLDPIVNLLKSNGISLQEASDYLYALHAAERNAAIDKINPGLGGEGSGMSNDEAEKILAEAKRAGNAAAFDELRQRVDGIRNLILDVMEKSGLEKPEVIAEWKKRYQEYVPLRGWEVEPDDAPGEFRGAGAGFNIRGKEVKQAFGRRSKADNPLVNLFDQAYRTFDRAERNRYLQSLFRAIDDLGEDADDIATLDKGKPRREINPRTGLVRTVETSSQYGNPKAVNLKFDGNPHFIVFRDQQLAEAVKRMGAGSLGILQPVLILQNKMKAMWTHYSPDFLFRHFMFRYPIEGALNSFEQKEGGAHKVSQYVREAFPFMGTASKAIFASNRGEISSDPEIARMQKEWDMMRRGGGAMMFRNMRDTDLTREHLETRLKDLSDSPLQNARAKWRHGVEAMDVVTNALDNALRLAAFSSALRQGKTVQQANFIAREATIDFQLKGLWSNLMGILFPFANPAVQTAARMTKAVSRSKIMRRVFMGTMLAGFLTSAYNYLIGGDDKDGTPFFDKIPEWDRRLNFIILSPIKDAKGRPEPIKIPMPYNWAFPLMLGYAFGGFMFGKEGPRKLMSMVLHSALETFTPLGSEGNLAAEFTPSTLRPVTYIYTNLDWAGRPVHADPTFQKHPNSYSGRRTTGEGWKDLAAGVNTATGGSPAKSGVIDIYPEDYREMMDQFVGTQLRLGQNVWDTVSAPIKGEWPDPGKVPLGRVVFGTDYDAADRARGYELRDKLKHPWKR